MRRPFCFILLFLGFISANAQDFERKSLDLTVYNSNLGVVRDVRIIDVKEGKNTLVIKNIPDKIRPTTVLAKFPGKIIEQNYQYDLAAFNSILQKYIGQEIMVGGKASFIGRLVALGDDNLVMQTKEGGLIMLPEFEDYTIQLASMPSNFITMPQLLWSADANKSGKQEVEITYQTEGLSWYTEYNLNLNADDTKADLSSWISLNNNSGMSYLNSNLKLVAGDIAREENMAYQEMNLKTTMGSQLMVQEEELFEYHLYEVPGRIDVLNNEIKQLSLFNASDLSLKKRYVHEQYYSMRAEDSKVAVYIDIENKKENNLGIPLPSGIVRIYKTSPKSTEFIGEDRISHTPANKKISLNVGNAFDISVSQKESEIKWITDKVYDTTVEMNILNSKKEDIVLEIVRYLGSRWSIVSESIKSEKRDASTIVYKLPVKKDSEATLIFTIRQGN